MPTYIVSAAAGLLAAPLKHRIAREITRVHSEVTGAQGFFAQVIFQDVVPGNHFVGGQPLQADHLFVHGHIRAGRGPQLKRELLERMVAALAEATAWPRRCIWTYLAELPPGQMAEYGHILPEPGDEHAWLAGLPEADRAYLKGLG